MIKFKSKAEAMAALAEVKRLQELPRPQFIDRSFVKQAAFIAAKFMRKCLKCTRRAGKSFGLGLLLYKEAYDFPGCSCIYIGLTRDTSKKIMWGPILKTINKKLGLDAKPNEAELTMTLPNGSVIYLVGGDASSAEMEKFLGGKLRVVVIDEAGSFRTDLRKMVYENLEPALADYDGYTVLAGTPTDLASGLFYDVTNGNEPGWELFEWNTFDNPYMESKWRKRIADLIAANPRIVETPGYKRMYLGEWAIDPSALVYKYDRSRNSIDSLPDGSYTYVLGIDLGFNDATSFVLCAYSEHDRNLYIVSVYKKTKMTVSDVAYRIEYMTGRHEISRMVIDGAAKQAVEELKQRFQLPLESAEKQGKAEFIEIMNSEYILGNIKLLPEAEELATEYGSLIWDDRAARREEHPNCENHAADGALYAFRMCLNYMSAPIIKVIKSDEEVIDEHMEREADMIDFNNQKPFWERDLDGGFGFGNSGDF